MDVCSTTPFLPETSSFVDVLPRLVDSTVGSGWWSKSSLAPKFEHT